MLAYPFRLLSFSLLLITACGSSSDPAAAPPPSPPAEPAATCEGDTCCGAPAPHMGDVRGDIGQDVITYQGTGSRVLWANVTEGSGDDLLSDKNMSFTAVLQPSDPNATFHLTALQSCDGAQFGASFKSPWRVGAGWGGTLGVDDSRIVMFQVEDVGGSSVPWTLTLSGATGAPPVDPCATVDGPAPTACADDPQCATPPAPSSGAPMGTGAMPTVLAIRTLRMGDVDAHGVPSMSAWSTYGWNLDGLHFTNACSPGHCAPVAGAKTSDVVPDGPGGLDNSFGKNASPVFTTFLGAFSTKVNDDIANGHATLVLVIPGLDAAADQTLAAAQLVPVAGVDDGHGGYFGTDADWTQYAWRPRSDVPPSTFDSPYVTGNTWVSGTGDVTLRVSASGVPLTFHVHHATITAPLDAARTKVEGGVISGVLDTAEFTVDMNQFMKDYSANVVDWCPGTDTAEGILGSLQAASDMMNDGTQSDAACNGISFAIGFDATASMLDTNQAPAVSLPKQCLLRQGTFFTRSCACFSSMTRPASSIETTFTVMSS